MGRSTNVSSGILLLCLGLFSAGVHLACGGEQAADRHQMTAADIERWMTELSNWGRWGEGDEMGAVNLITPAKRRAAAQLVQEGVSVSLARNAEMTEAVDNPYPFVQEMKMTPPFASDVFSVRYHGYAHTHIDALCHLMHGGELYNGFPESEVTVAGADKLGILELKNGIFTRGILMDIPRLKKVPYLEPKTAIYPEDLESWERQAGVEVASGGRGLHPDRPLGPARREGALGRGEQLRGASRVLRQVVAAAGRRPGGQRRRVGRPPVADRGRRPAGPSVAARFHGSPHLRQLRP